MPATPQSQAIQTANNICAAASNLMSLYQQIVAIDQVWSDNGVANTLNAMGTVTLNSDGTAGAADGIPNVAHPLNPSTYQTLQHMLSSNQIASLKTILDGIVSYVGGSSVTTQASARGILNSGIGG